jgi:hypothetical protein
LNVEDRKACLGRQQILNSITKAGKTPINSFSI